MPADIVLWEDSWNWNTAFI